MVGIRKYKFYEGKFFERDMTNKEVKQTSFIIIIDNRNKIVFISMVIDDHFTWVFRNIHTKTF